MYDFQSSSGFAPTGVNLYADDNIYKRTSANDSAPSDIPALSATPTDAENEARWQYLVDRGKVTIAKGDTFNTLEGNMYDFGGYWNYNLGNSYAEDHLDQSAELNKTRDYDLLDDGGSSWTEVDWETGLESSTSASSKIGSGDIEIGSSNDWNDTGGSTNAWVSKQFGRSYSYSEVDSIEVNKGSSLNIQRGGKHVEVGFRGSGSMKSWSWSSSGVKKAKKWNESGALLYKMESDVSDGIATETQWNPYPADTDTPIKLSEKTEDDNSGTVSETTYCRDTENMIAYSSKHQGFNSTHTYDFNWANTASASLDFAAGAAFSLNLSEQGSINIDISAAQSLNFSLSSDISLNFKAGIDAEWTFPLPGVGILLKNEIDLSTLKIDLDVTGFQCKFMGVDLKAKKAAIDIEKASAIKLKRRGMRLEGGQLALLQEQLRVSV